MNRRTSIEDLQLQASPNLRRAIRRQAAEESAPELSKQRLDEIDRVTGLIQRCLKECKQGSTIGAKRKSNPAFRNLALLVKTRAALLLQGSSASGKKVVDFLAEADEFLKRAGVN